MPATLHTTDTMTNGWLTSLNRDQPSTL